MTDTTTAPPATTATIAALHRPWQDSAACRGLPTDLFFGRPDKYGVDRHDEADLRKATRVCGRCAVREECLADALDRGADVDGVWGGATKKDRERLTRRIPRVKCPICAASTLHAYHGWQACGSCGHSWPTARTGTQPTHDQRVENAEAA
jgi:WhiB family transcriptional regulator, redox-sensing transcriptional regulator